MAKALMCLSGSTRLQLCRLGAFRRPLQLQTRPADPKAKATATGKRIQKRTGEAACRGWRACAVGALQPFALRPRTPAPLISPLPLLWPRPQLLGEAARFERGRLQWHGRPQPGWRLADGAALALVNPIATSRPIGSLCPSTAAGRGDSLGIWSCHDEPRPRTNIPDSHRGGGDRWNCVWQHRPFL